MLARAVAESEVEARILGDEYRGHGEAESSVQPGPGAGAACVEGRGQETSGVEVVGADAPQQSSRAAEQHKGNGKPTYDLPMAGRGLDDREGEWGFVGTRGNVYRGKKRLGSGKVVVVGGAAPEYGS
jgi:hypothetical protein